MELVLLFPFRHLPIFPCRIFLTKNHTLGAAQAQLYILLTKFTSCITSESIELREGSDCPSHWRCKKSSDLAESCKSSCIVRSGGSIWAWSRHLIRGQQDGCYYRFPHQLLSFPSTLTRQSETEGHTGLSNSVSAPGGFLTKWQVGMRWSDWFNCWEPPRSRYCNETPKSSCDLPTPPKQVCKWGHIPAKTTGPWPTPSQRLICHPSPQQSWVWLTKLLGKVTFIFEDRIETHLNVIQLLYVFYVVFQYVNALCFSILVLITTGFVTPS